MMGSLKSTQGACCILLRVLICGAFLASAALAPAVIVAPEGLSLRTLEEFSANGIPEDQWPALLEAFGRADQSSAVRTLIKTQKPFPGPKLVEFLTHRKLALRLGALDLLEEAAGETFNFDPFQEEPAAGNNAEALARWKAWIGAADPKPAARSLTEETFRALALEIMSGNRDRAERAMQRLDAFGMAAIAHLESFFNSQPALEPAAKAALKAAEYRVVLLQFLPKQGAGLARELSLGTLEAQSIALAALGKAGPGVLPVIAEFLTSEDPLVRETAVDAAFEAGKVHAVGLVAERLKSEKTESVLHAMLRGLGAHGQTAAQIAAVMPFVKHPSENVVVSALEALGVNKNGDASAVLSGSLNDARWRVRAAGLEAIGKRKLKGLSGEIKKRLHDSDLFVRVSAVEALQEVTGNTGGNDLITQFELQHELKAPILRTFFKGRNNPPEQLWKGLWKAPPEIILQCLETLEDRDDHEGKRIPLAAPFATHPNRDVSAAALRLLASRGRHSALLLEALNSADPVKADAVLDALMLPSGFLLAAPPEGQSAPAKAARASVIDRLYRAFGGSPPVRSKEQRAGGLPPLQNEAHAAPAEMRAVLERFFREGSPRQRFRSAAVLAGQNDLAATAFLLAGYDTFSDLDRRTLLQPLSGLPAWPPGPTLDLAVRLLRDNADDVRQDAIEMWLKPGHLGGILAELVRPGSRLQPDDLYDWKLERCMEMAGSAGVVLEWARPLLSNPAGADAHKVLAIILLARTGQKELITPFLKPANPWLRRAAFRALGLTAMGSHLEACLRDESAFVRAALPFVASPHNGGWRHWFDDVHSVRDYEDHERERFSSGAEFGAWAQKRSKVSAAGPEILAALEKLSRDPSEMVRFEALFSLLRLDQPVDPSALAALLSSQAEESEARSRIGNFLEKKFAKLGPGYGVLVPLATEIDPGKLPEILAHFGMEKEFAFTSFAALAKLTPIAGRSPDNSVAAAPPILAASSDSFRIIFFYKVGCRDCERVREMLNRHARDFPRMLIEEHDIDDPRETLLSEALSERFKLREAQHQAAPALFTQAGSLVREQITFPSMGDLLRKTSVLPPDPHWARVETADIAKADQNVRHRYETLGFGVIAAAGLLDGINPCAFATVIFLLSYMQVARRTPREILAVGSAFILAVFLTYFAVGLGLAQVLSRISGLRTAGAILTHLLAAFALVVAILSFRDARLAALGQTGEMTLQLPGVLKNQIRSVIREGSRATHFVWAAFAGGVVISLLELACTGQVYLPTILYMVHSGEAGALRRLLVYNLAFILPLVVIFALAWGGLRTDALIRFQTERTALVKTLTGVLFLALAAFLLFGHMLR